ncbi:hypothetical protein V8E53_008057 [Lactarius tabidus]
MDDNKTWPSATNMIVSGASELGTLCASYLYQVIHLHIQLKKRSTGTDTAVALHPVSPHASSTRHL